MKNKYKKLKDSVVIYLMDRESVVRQTVIDKEDFDKANNYSGTFFASFRPDSDSYYACITEYRGTKNGKPKYVTVTLHQIVLENIAKGSKIHVDHIDCNTLNNKKYNLRITTTSNNLKNRKSRNKNNTSGYRNVTWMSGYWRVQLQIDGKNKLFPEKFTDVHLAGEFAEEMRKEYYGEFAGNN